MEVDDMSVHHHHMPWTVKLAAGLFLLFAAELYIYLLIAKYIQSLLN